jgi:hypothetical protein
MYLLLARDFFEARDLLADSVLQYRKLCRFQTGDVFPISLHNHWYQNQRCLRPEGWR